MKTIIRGGASVDPARTRPPAQAVTILGAPVEAGAGVAGCAMGPAMLRTAGIVRTLRDLGHDVVDRGDVAPGDIDDMPPPEGRARHAAEIASWTRALARETYAVMREGRLPVVLGGDHALAMGSIAGVARYADGVGAQALRALARRALGLQHAADLALRQYARHVGRNAERRAGLRLPVRRRDAWTDRARPAASLRHPVDRRRRASAPAARAGSTSSTCARSTSTASPSSIRRIIERVQAARRSSARQPRRRFPRSLDRAGGRHCGSGRGDLSRSASGDGAFVRVRPVALARPRRAQSLSRRARQRARCCWSISRRACSAGRSTCAGSCHDKFHFLSFKRSKSGARYMSARALSTSNIL